MQTQFTDGKTVSPRGEVTCGCHILSQAPEVTRLVHSHMASRSICSPKKSGGQWGGGVVCACRRGQGKTRGHGSNSWGHLAEQTGSSHVPAPVGCGCSDAVQADSGEDAGMDR